ncbi:hypothetical protein IW152_000991 [Coemansia sp. BCRC 34962]|nr:hypothetical protein IW152_000991 [Coemansia sp. BCRC 34962]
MAAGHSSLRDQSAYGGLARTCQTRCLYQAIWRRETARPLSTASTEGAPTLLGQSIAQKTETTREVEDPIDSVSLRVGRIDSVTRHPEADMLYVLSVDLGERSSTSAGGELLETSQCRTIVSGLVPYYSPEQLQGLHAVIFANLKPRKLRGIVSHGMLLAASSLENDGSLAVEILEAPASSRPGDGIFASPPVAADACSDSLLAQASEKPLVKKQKLVDLFTSGLSLDARLLSYNGRKLVTGSGGEISTRTMLKGVVR